MFFHSIEQARRFFKILGGFTLLGLGAVMLFTPGPGWLVIFLGLTLLAAEFVWARRLMDRMKKQGTRKQSEQKSKELKKTKKGRKNKKEEGETKK